MTAHLVSKKGRLKFLYPPARGRDGISEAYAMRRRFFRAESFSPAGAQLRNWSLDKIEKLRKWIADGKNP
jgi:hypothetical protein